jgi:hypothetical protein
MTCKLRVYRFEIVCRLATTLHITELGLMYYPQVYRAAYNPVTFRIPEESSESTTGMSEYILATSDFPSSQICRVITV